MSSTQYEHEIYEKISWTKADPVGRCDTFSAHAPFSQLSCCPNKPRKKKVGKGKREKNLFVQIQWQFCYQSICSVGGRYDKPSRWCRDEINSWKRNSTGEKLRKHMNKRNPFAIWGFIHDSLPRRPPRLKTLLVFTGKADITRECCWGKFPTASICENNYNKFPEHTRKSSSLSFARAVNQWFAKKIIYVLRVTREGTVEGCLHFWLRNCYWGNFTRLPFFYVRIKLDVSSDRTVWWGTWRSLWQLLS